MNLKSLFSKTPAPAQTKLATLTDAELEFLSRFLSPRLVESEQTSTLFKTLVSGGYLEDCPPEQKLNELTATEIKAALRARNLKVSGKKEELIKRLLDADPNAAIEMTKNVLLMQCSSLGKPLAESYRERVRGAKREAESAVRGALIRRDFRHATQLVANYEAQQPTPRGIGIDWKQYDPARDVQCLKYIFAYRPRWLESLAPAQQEELRLAAAFALLWGKQPELGFSVGQWDAATAARQIEFYALNRAELEELQKWQVTDSVEIVSDEDSCPACRQLHGKKYPVTNPPALPHLQCTYSIGCRCSYKAILH